MKKLVISLLIASSILGAHQSVLGMKPKPKKMPLDTPAPRGINRAQIRALGKALIQAAKDRDWTTVQKLIENPLMEIDSTDIDKNTALIYAVRAQNIEQSKEAIDELIDIVDLLLVCKANPMHTNNLGESAYSLALASNNPELIARFAPTPQKQLPIQITIDPMTLEGIELYNQTGCKTEAFDYFTASASPEYPHACMILAMMYIEINAHKEAQESLAIAGLTTKKLQELALHFLTTYPVECSINELARKVLDYAKTQKAPKSTSWADWANSDEE